MRYFLAVSYHGFPFHGSQIQGEQPTVQLCLNKAISTLLRRSIATYGASRTDTGVQALCSYYHFDSPSALPDNFVYRLNAILPFEIAVLDCRQPVAGEKANCRFDALSRQYIYRIYTKKNPFLHQRAYYFPFAVNREILPKTAALLIGQHDFTTFSKRKTQSKTFISNIEAAKWTFKDNEFSFTVRANRFLRGMVRALVGTQLKVARGKMDYKEFAGLFDKKDCRLADFSVPGHGLYLQDIKYPEGYFL